MKNTPHLWVAELPKLGDLAKTVCGKEIPQPFLLALPEEVRDPVDYPGLCAKCKAGAAKGINYFGAIVTGEESRHAE